MWLWVRGSQAWCWVQVCVSRCLKRTTPRFPPAAEEAPAAAAEEEGAAVALEALHGVGTFAQVGGQLTGWRLC